MKFKKIVACLLVLTISQQATASIGGALKNYYNNMAAGQKIERPQLTTNGFTTGGFYSRAPNVDLELGHITSPSITGGCGNIDFHMGGFSFISGDQIVKALQAIGRDAKGLLFMEGIEIVSSMFAGELKHWIAELNKWMGILKNSCQAASALVGGVNKAMGLCENANRYNDTLSDENTVQSTCQANDKALEDIKQIFHKKDSELTDAQKQAKLALELEIASQGGLLHNILAKYFLTGGKVEGIDAEFGDFVLSTAGDIYVQGLDKDNDPKKAMANPIAILPISNMEKVVEVTLKNSKTSATDNPMPMYKCDFAYDSEKNHAVNPCVASISDKSYVVDKTNSIYTFYNQIKTDLDSLGQTIRNPQSSSGITNEQLRLISMSEAPIFQILQTSNDIGNPEIGATIVENYMDYTIHKMFEKLYGFVVAQAANEAAVLGGAKDYEQKYQELMNTLKSNQSILQEQIKKDLIVNGKNLDLNEVYQRLQEMKQTLQGQVGTTLLGQLSYSQTQLNSGAR